MTPTGNTVTRSPRGRVTSSLPEGKFLPVPPIICRLAGKARHMEPPTPRERMARWWRRALGMA